MTPLAETAYYTRQTIKYGSIGLVVLIVGRFLVNAGITLYTRLNPPPPPPPTVGFGQLPRLSFPSNNPPKYNYILETVSGVANTPSDRAPVYFMPIIRPNLLALERATETAANMGFVFAPQAITERLYRFSRTSPLPARLDFDIITGNFGMSVDWWTNDLFLQEKLLPNDNQAISEAKSFLNRADLLPSDLDDGLTKVSYLKASGRGYIGALSLSEADFIQVDFFREPIADSFEVLTPSPQEGIVRVIISGSRTQGQRLVWVKYDYFPVDLNNFETYPIKSGPQAWEELLAGQGYIISLAGQQPSATVRNVNLGYYDDFDPQNYLQPVYIFTGDNGFKAIVPAIEATWVQAE